MLPVSLQTPATTSTLTPQTTNFGYMTAGEQIIDYLRSDDHCSLMHGIMFGVLLTLQVADNVNAVVLTTKSLPDRSQLCVNFGVAGRIEISAVVHNVIKDSFKVFPCHHAWYELCATPELAGIYADWQAWEKEPHLPDEDRSKALKLVKDSLCGRSGTFLNLNGLNLRSLPAHLPPQVTHLSVNQNRLVSLPRFSEGLITLTVNENALTQLPQFPRSLRTLDASKNKIDRFPFLPANLRVLDLSHNNLTSVPGLPKYLTHVYLANNFLNFFPDFPPGIEELDIGYNKLTSLSSLPDTAVATSDCEKPGHDVPDYSDSNKASLLYM